MKGDVVYFYCDSYFFWENADADTILKHLLTFREENNLNMEKHADFNVWS